LGEQGTGRDGLGEDTGMQLSGSLGRIGRSRGCGALIGMEAGGIPKRAAQGVKTADATFLTSPL